MNSNLQNQNSSARACVFELGGVLFAVPGKFTRQILTLDALTRVPRAPEDLLGLFAVRGQIYPVVRIEGSLGLKPNLSEPRMAVQVEFETKHMALVIDAVIGFNPIGLQLEPVTDARFTALSLGQILVDARVVHVLDLGKLVQVLASRIAMRELARA